MAKKQTPPKKKPPTKQVPKAGETIYTVINPAQIEKLEEAIKSVVGRVVFAFPDGFWVKFYAGCYASQGFDPATSVKKAAELISEINKAGKRNDNRRI